MMNKISSFIAGTRKTTAVLAGVVFLLSITGCRSIGHDHRGNHRGDGLRSATTDSSSPAPVRQRKMRRRARDYSRIPGNYPAEWQHRSIGN